MRAHPAEPPDLSPGRRRGGRRSGLVAALALGAVLAGVTVVHRLLSSADGAEPALVIALAWLAGCAVLASLGSARPRLALAATAAGLVAAVAAWPWLLARVDLVYLAQHAGTHLLLGATFAVTLLQARRGRGVALITRLALQVHGTLPAEIHRYTDRLTVLWTVYFGLMAAASLLVFAFGTLAAWSVLANLVTPPVVVALFVGEYAFRRRRFPHFRHAALLDGVRAFRQ